jgi:hypothetical protein
MINYMKNTLYVFALLIFAFSVNYTEASEITVWPLVIDEELSPRDGFTKKITINSSYENRKAVLYATVNEITVDEVGKVKEFVSPVATDRTNTVTSWIEITRGRIEVGPTESIEVPITITTHPQAKPGDYYAFIGFVEASKRYEAEAVALAGQAKGVVLKISIIDSRKDSLHIKSFYIDRFVTGETNRIVTIEVENTGDLPVIPTGEIIFYNYRGEETVSVPVTGNLEAIEPGVTQSLTANVPLKNTLGKYKANLALAYGDNQKAMLYDTTFFYMMPSHLMLLLSLGGFLMFGVIVWLLRRVFAHGNEEDYEDDDELPLYVKQGHSVQPQHHDIDLKNKL